MQYDDYQLLRLIRNPALSEELLVRHSLSGRGIALHIPYYVVSKDGYSWNIVSSNWVEGLLIHAGLLNKSKTEKAWFVPDTVNLRIVVMPSKPASTELGSTGYSRELYAGLRVGSEWEYIKSKDFIRHIDWSKYAVL